MQQTAMQACIRIKPLSQEQQRTVDVINGCVVMKKTGQRFVFENVFNQKTSNSQVYQAIGPKTLDYCLKGYNCCIFVYGQTSSGKTHTISGCQQSPGLIPLFLNNLFILLNKVSIIHKKQVNCSVRVGYIQIYNEQVKDLLDGKNVQVRQGTQGIRLVGMNWKQVKQQKGAYAVLQYILTSSQGQQKKKYAFTNLNEHSSRSHSIFKILLDIRTKDKIFTSQINLVDLAGSQTASKAKTEGIRKKQGQKINKSLLALSLVIRSLSQKTNTFINYRDSKLTRILQNSLSGNSRTIVICTINPKIESIQETLNTLKFGINASSVKMLVKVNQAQIDQLKQGNRQIEKELQKRLANQVTRSQQNQKRCQQLMQIANKKNVQMVKQLQQIERVKHQNQVLQGQVNRLTTAYSQMKKLNLQFKQKLTSQTNHYYFGNMNNQNYKFQKIKMLQQSYQKSQKQRKQLLKQLNEQEFEYSQRKQTFLENSYKKQIFSSIKKQRKYDKENQMSWKKERQLPVMKMRHLDIQNLPTKGKEPIIDKQTQILKLEAEKAMISSQKNQVIALLMAKVSELSKQVALKDHKINQYEQNQRELNEDNEVSLKRKRTSTSNLYKDISSRIKMCPEKDELIRMLKSAQIKIKRVQHQLTRSRNREQKISQLFKNMSGMLMKQANRKRQLI